MVVSGWPLWVFTRSRHKTKRLAYPCGTSKKRKQERLRSPVAIIQLHAQRILQKLRLFDHNALDTKLVGGILDQGGPITDLLIVSYPRMGTHILAPKSHF